MDAQIKAKWVAALRSGKYKQGRRALKQKDKNGVVCHCCLGVLLEVLGPEVVQSEKYNECTMRYKITDVTGEKSTDMPTRFAREVAGFRPYECSSLAELNDGGTASFEDIALEIERRM
jgi:hypothetical protein